MDAAWAFYLGIAVGIGLGFVLAAAVGLIHKSRKPMPALPLQPHQPENRYGHPHPPVNWLRSHIRQAPLGAAWEIKVHHDDKGQPWLHLSLVDLALGATVASTKRDLVNDKYHTWTSSYRSYPSLKGETFKNDLMGPLLDWAEKTYNEYANKGADGEYSLS